MSLKLLTTREYLRKAVREGVDASQDAHWRDVCDGLDGVAWHVQRSTLVLACTIGAAALLIVGAVLFG